jgi:hypothetical protein
MEQNVLIDVNITCKDVVFSCLDEFYLLKVKFYRIQQNGKQKFNFITLRTIQEKKSV